MQTTRRVDVPFVPWREERRKERQSLDMVPVIMADEQCALNRSLRRGSKAAPEVICAGSTVDDNQLPRCSTYFHAGGVSAIFQLVQAGPWDRAACSPEFQKHRFPPCVDRSASNFAMTPGHLSPTDTVMHRRSEMQAGSFARGTIFSNHHIKNGP